MIPILMFKNLGNILNREGEEKIHKIPFLWPPSRDIQKNIQFNVKLYIIGFSSSENVNYTSLFIIKRFIHNNLLFQEITTQRITLG